MDHLTEARASCALDGETRLVPGFVWIAIDPGTTESAFCAFDNERLLHSATQPNAEVAARLRGLRFDWLAKPENRKGYAHLAIEMVACYGMAVGEEVFETCLWTGRFIEAFGGPFTKIYRQDEKLHLCGNVRAKDANIRQRLIDLYGGESVAIGGVKCPECKGKGWAGRGRKTCPLCDGAAWKHPPGPLAEVTGDQWAALAVARTWWDTKRKEHRP